MSYTGKTYKWCVVPLCTSTTIRTPDKLFVHVPLDVKRRRNWLKLARRDFNTLSTKTALYMCEDHFNLQEDMKNYIEYKIMGSVKVVMMNQNCIPTKFDCQPDRQKRSRRASPTPSRSVSLKRQKIDVLNEAIGPNTVLAEGLPAVKEESVKVKEEMCDSTGIVGEQYDL